MDKRIAPALASPRAAVALPTPDEMEDVLEARTGDAGLLALSLLLWLCAAGAAFAAWEARASVPTLGLRSYGAPLPVATQAPRLEVGPILASGGPTMGRIVPDAAAFMVEAGTALARDEAESTLLKLELLQRAGALVTARLK